MVENKSLKTTNINFSIFKKFTYLLAHHYTSHSRGWVTAGGWCRTGPPTLLWRI